MPHAESGNFVPSNNPKFINPKKQFMIKYILRQFKNTNSSVNNKWLAYPVIDETIGLDELSEHMSKHNTPFSAGAIKGMLTDIIGCIKEPEFGIRNML